jgi:hypothetical protein
VSFALVHHSEIKALISQKLCLKQVCCWICSICQ